MTTQQLPDVEPRESRLRTVFTPDRRAALFAFGAAVLIYVVAIGLHSRFASWDEIRAILVNASFIGFVAAGQMFVVLVGGIDLSVPWVLNGAAILLVTQSLGRDSRAWWAVLLTLGMGLAAGLANGIGVAFLAIPAVVMTLAMNGIMFGLTEGLSNGLTCGSCASYAPKAIQDVINNKVVSIPGVLFLWVGVILLISVVLSMTSFGRRVYATGNNPIATYLAGTNVKAVTVVLYMLSGMFAALAGIVLVAFGGQASLGMGDPFLFQSIAAVVIGGVSILGGRGTYVGTAAGAVTLVVLITLLNAENIPDWGRNVVYGVVILVILLLYGREKRSA